MDRPRMERAVSFLRNAFTLIEILVVIAVVAILSVVIILVLNPAELIKRSRDSTRLSDMMTLNRAIGVFLADQPSGSLGSASTTYVSVPDSSADCSNLGLPGLPTGWSYRCVPSSTLRNVNGTGWLPVDLTSISAGAPIGQLPTDPLNATSTALYYSYVTGLGKYETAAFSESNRYAAQAALDGGYDPERIEVGTDATIWRSATGLVGYWKFDEDAGSLADSSGLGGAGSASGGVTYGAAGKKGTALTFNGSTGQVAVSDNGTLTDPPKITISAWIYPTVDQYGQVVAKNGNSGYRYRLDQGRTISWLDRGGNNMITTTDLIPLNQWTMVTVTGDSSGLKIFINGVLSKSGGGGYNAPDSSANLYIGSIGGSEVFAGSIDDVRLYSRALSASEILAIYNATR